MVKSILQWRERQSESFGERILQALKGPCGSSTPHSACVFHTRSNCNFVDSLNAQRRNVTIKTPQDSQHPRARAVHIGNVVIPCQCVVKYQPKVFMCPDLGDGDPVHSHKWALFRCPSNCEMLALWGAKEHAPSFSSWGCCVEIRTKTCTAWYAGLIGSVQCCIISKDRTLALGGLGKIVNKNQEEHWSKDRALWYPWLWGQWCRCCAVQKNTLFSVREEAGEPFQWQMS